MPSNQNNHSEREHARLSPSSAERWINCPKSIVLQEALPEQRTSAYAEEGELAHELSEVILLANINKIDKVTAIKRADEIEKQCDLKGFDYGSMQDHCENYANYVMELYNECKLQDPLTELIIEQRIDLTEWTEGFGSNDAVIVSEKILHVIDLKYGQGVRVSADDNSQLKLYALGAYHENLILFDPEIIVLHIVQPRVYNYSTFDLTPNDLIQWADNVVKPAAVKALRGEGECKAGSWCKWCTVKPQCREVKSFVESVVKPTIRPELLSDEELETLITQAPFISEYLESVKSYALDAQMSGDRDLPGYKVVEGRSNRKWIGSKESEIISIMREEGYADTDFLNSKLKGIGDMEKLIGKKEFPKILGDYIEKPKGKPTLAPKSDKRDPWSETSSDDFDVSDL